MPMKTSMFSWPCMDWMTVAHSDQKFSIMSAHCEVHADGGPLVQSTAESAQQVCSISEKVVCTREMEQTDSSGVRSMLPVLVLLAGGGGGG